jgi:hypothetical protein
MTPHQARMARTTLKWSLVDVGMATKVGWQAVADLEAGRPVSPWVQAAVREVFEAEHTRFVDAGWLAGGIIRSRLRFLDSRNPAVREGMGQGRCAG